MAPLHCFHLNPRRKTKRGCAGQDQSAIGDLREMTGVREPSEADSMLERKPGYMVGRLRTARMRISYIRPVSGLPWENMTGEEFKGFGIPIFALDSLSIHNGEHFLQRIEQAPEWLYRFA